jgi:LysM repeat protein
MSRVAELFRARRASPVAVVALISAGLAGCSADSHRFAENPFVTRQQEATGSVPQPHPAPAAPYGRVESRPLPQYGAPPQTAPAYGYQRQSNLQPSGTSGGGRGLAAYAPPSQHPMETTASTAPRSIAANGGTWSAADGTTIIVGTNDTVDTLAQRYGVPSKEIMRANGLPTPRNLQPGQQLVIPRQMMPPHRRPSRRPLSLRLVLAASMSSIRVRRCTVSPAGTTSRRRSSPRPTTCR